MVISEEERRARKKEYFKEYRTRPEVKTKEKARLKEYNARPEVKDRKNAWQKKNRTRSEVRAKENERNKERMREYTKRPEVIEKRKEYRLSPKIQAKERERYARPETKEVQNKYRESPHGKAKMKEYYTSTKVKTKKRGINAKFDEEAKTIIARGNLKCVCCGNKNFEWLQIDHIVPQRKKNKENTVKLKREIAQGKRSDSEFQLLCANCNFAKRDLKACPIDHSLD